ncbi:hypothetical protein ACFFS2_30735 [Streptomyces aurantiacus]|uniref:Uncharacterized protein n=1 Tax=Streptomyces aurantiacus TaxID=47760 RepID=A0A7G1P3Y2_9ACTN|nr:hypothetical protein [Streptomyces aurantiacus]BCL28517.1 hypothetical protein GCM10017557_33760 [Streptomyces aurantiacus]
MAELDRETEVFTHDMQARDPEFAIMEFYAVVYESDGNLARGGSLAAER